MKPKNIKTKIFLDSGDPEETKEIIKLMGFLDGQTTNPTLISKNPEVASRLENGEKFTKEEIYDFYKKVVTEISNLIPEGSISIEVYADKNTPAEEIYKQGSEMFTWIPNAHIKYPIIEAGLKAAEKTINNGMRVNMTLCFTEEQAAAVYSATKGAKSGDVFVSPFIGRLDDLGLNGMDLIKNILKMNKNGDGHVEILTASVRNMEHFIYSLKIKSDIITAPFKILKEWVEKGMPIPGDNYTYDQSPFDPIPYKEFNLQEKWNNFDIHHDLTDKGIERFSSDWNKLIK